MKLDKQIYKTQHSPTCLFLGYILGSIACVIGLDYFRRLLINVDFKLWILNDVLRMALFLIAYVIAGICFCWIFMFIFGYRTKKIYRGIAFYRFINIMAIISPCSIVVFVVLANILNFNINFHTLSNMIALAAEILIPCFIRFACYNKYFIRRCPYCGLINTMKQNSSSERETGTRFEVYNGGVFQYKPVGYVISERESTVQNRCSICGGYDYDHFNYETRV